VVDVNVLILASKPVVHGQLFVGGLESPLLIPFRGRPLIAHLEEQFQGFELIYAISQNADRTHALIKNNYSQSKIIFLPDKISNGTTGDSLLFCLEKLSYPENVLTLHGDNLYEFDEYPGATSPNTNYAFKIDIQNSNYSYYQAAQLTPKAETICSKTENLVNTGAHFIKASNIINRAEGVSIDVLMKEFEPEIVCLTNWIDLGHWDLISRHNLFFHARSFNSMYLSTDKSSITKISLEKKILREFQHLNDIPEEFTFLFPRVKAMPELQGYEIENWPLKSLSEYLVFWNLDMLTWSNILKKLMNVLNRFSSYPVQVQSPKQDLGSIYTKILDERLAMYDMQCTQVLNYDYIYLNKVKLKGLSKFSEVLYQDLQRIGASMVPTFYHGDLCLSNVLYSPDTEIIKFIDPKGSLFLESTNCGDIRYDLAKLHHSIIGNFDYFSWSMFSLSQENESFHLEIVKQNGSKDLANKFCDTMLAFYSPQICHDVEILSAVLFLSMVPLHSDSSVRQKALLLQGLSMLNSIYLD